MAQRDPEVIDWRIDVDLADNSSRHHFIDTIVDISSLGHLSNPGLLLEPDLIGTIHTDFLWQRQRNRTYPEVAPLLYSSLLTVSVFFITALIHLGALRWCSRGMAAIPLTPSARVLAVAALLFTAHIAEIALYAITYFLAEHVFLVGGFAGLPIAAPLDYFYFSATVYTSLGIGDIFPTGHIRFLTGIEALNGLLLVAWSASFLFALMNRIWEWQPCVRPKR